MFKNENFQLYDGAQNVDTTAYRSLVGSFIYLTNIRPNIVFLLVFYPDL